jgi:7-cyano-7-deazaguanine synthase
VKLPDGGLLLLSGGVDSAALAALLRPRHALFIDYGQKPAAGELRAARAIAEDLDMELEILRIDCRQIGSGLLTGRGASPGAPSPEWWPYRNQLLATLAAAWAHLHGLTAVLFGTVSSDGVRHKDGTRKFMTLLDGLTAYQEGGVRIEAPAIGMTSDELVRKSGADRSLLGWTFSCHVAPLACAQCPGCTKQREVLAHLPEPPDGVVDRDVR